MINDIGLKRNKYVKREAIKMLFLGPLFSFVYIFLSFISMSKWPAFFLLVAPLLIILMIIFFIMAPIKLLKRHNKTIKEISFQKSDITFTVFQALWMKPKTITTNKNKVKIIPSKFNWYGKDKVNGYIIQLVNNQEYYLVPEYFIEKDKIETYLQL